MDACSYLLSVFVITEVEKNNLEFMQWLADEDQYHEVFGVAQSLPVAVDQNNVEMLQHLFDTYREIEWEEPAGWEYSKRDLKTIKWLEEHLNWASQEEIHEQEDNPEDSDWEDSRCLHSNGSNTPSSLRLRMVNCRASSTCTTIH